MSRVRVLCAGSATCNSSVVAPISANPLLVTHAYNVNNAAVKVSVEGTDVMGECVHPTLATSVESCTAEMLITVSASDCSYPVVVIVNQASVFTLPRISYRSKQLDLHAVVDIYCETTLLNTKVGSLCLRCESKTDYIVKPGFHSNAIACVACVA